MNFYESMWKIMSDTELRLPVHLDAIRREAYEATGDIKIVKLSDLRVFDIVVWSHARHPHL
ncbi:hypothetical protein [Corynebacterium neomassiliense]|uniref:hypothetical protein n=1 Tax=Corynebacterium neomassiliense TaxID=2079482 RepID=UPI001031811B